jgi:fructosamine-3-kinase
MERGGNWSAFGAALAKMHQVSAPQFGLGRSNYIGSLVQENTAKGSWAEFYSKLRLYPLMKKIIDRRLLTFDDGKRLDALVRELPSIYPEEKPSLLHGDLWSGNAAFSGNLPCIYDPAVYYGHREMDIAMTYLFGGFPNEMIVSYNSLYPLGRGWRERLEISQLYPLLVHSLLFGGTYTTQVKEILKRF